MNLIKPQALKAGDSVASVSLSWGGAGEVPYRFERGALALEEAFGINVVPAPNSLRPDWELYDNPQLRLDDLIWALENPEIKGIFSNIGGDDSIRVAQLADERVFRLIREHPKPFIGFSDSTVIHYMFLKAGVRSFYGPCIMGYWADNGGVRDYVRDGVERALFSSAPIGELYPAGEWSIEKIDWSEELADLPKTYYEDLPRETVQGGYAVEGRLIGGCMEVLEMLKGTFLWPEPDVWKGAVLFLEVSENHPAPEYVRYWLRNYAAQGILQNAAAVLFGRPGATIRFDSETYEEEGEEYLHSLDLYEEELAGVCAECGRSDMPVISRMDFGHTFPAMTLPFGARVRVDPENRRVDVLESGVKPRR